MSFPFWIFLSPRLWQTSITSSDPHKNLDYTYSHFYLLQGLHCILLVAPCPYLHQWSDFQHGLCEVLSFFLNFEFLSTIVDRAMKAFYAISCTLAHTSLLHSKVHNSLGLHFPRIQHPNSTGPYWPFYPRFPPLPEWGNTKTGETAPQFCLCSLQPNGVNI